MVVVAERIAICKVITFVIFVMLFRVQLHKYIHTWHFTGTMLHYIIFISGLYFLHSQVGFMLICHLGNENYRSVMKIMN